MALWCLDTLDFFSHLFLLLPKTSLITKLPHFTTLCADLSLTADLRRSDEEKTTEELNCTPQVTSGLFLKHNVEKHCALNNSSKLCLLFFPKRAKSGWTFLCISWVTRSELLEFLIVQMRHCSNFQTEIFVMLVACNKVAASWVVFISFSLTLNLLLSITAWQTQKNKKFTDSKFTSLILCTS